MSVYKRKHKYMTSWMVDVTFPDGRRFRKMVSTNKAAKLLEAKLKQEIFENKWQVRSLPQTKFIDFIKQKYLKHIKQNQSKTTYSSNFNRLKKNIIPYFGKMSLPMISRQRIDNYKTMRTRQGAKANTVKNELVCISNVLATAISWGYLFFNPAAGIKKPKAANMPPKFLTDKEAEKLIKACAKHLRPIIITALHTGMRKSELLNLQWTDIDFKYRQITIRSKADWHTKNYDYRYVGINETLLAVLSQLSRESEYVFTYRGQKIKDVKRSLQAAYKKARLPYGGLHILRHTFATNLIKKGVELEKIQQLLGHADFATTLQYAHLSSRAIKDVVNKLDNK